jgi:hypothetical protein
MKMLKQRDFNCREGVVREVLFEKVRHKQRLAGG